jgi:hypothetical protein
MSSGVTDKKMKHLQFLLSGKGFVVLQKLVYFYKAAFYKKKEWVSFEK